MTEILRPYKALLSLVPVGLLVASLVGAVLVAMRCQKGTNLATAIMRTSFETAVALWLMVLVIVTVPRAGGLGARSVELVPFGELGSGSKSAVLARMVGNVLLFFPIGFLVPLRWRSTDSLARVTILGGGLSLAVELTQFFIRTGRQTSVTDLLLNTFGAGLGYGSLVFSVSSGATLLDSRPGGSLLRRLADLSRNARS